MCVYSGKIKLWNLSLIDLCTLIFPIESNRKASAFCEALYAV